MRALLLAPLLWLAALPVWADTEVDRLIDAMGVPQLVAAFSQDGIEAAGEIDTAFLNGQGGDVFVETVRKLHDPARLEAQIRAGMRGELTPLQARTALLFFEADPGTRIIALEVEARRAMVDAAVEEAARAAADRADDTVRALLDVRDLVVRNTDLALAAQGAFFDGLAFASGSTDPSPDIEGQRPRVMAETEAWVAGYYVLVASALKTGDMDTYVAFWETEVGQAVDAALYTAFEEVYVGLSYGLGQAVGRLSPQNEL